ncbi:MAG: cytochrome c1 [Pseudomonadota bacterium]
MKKLLIGAVAAVIGLSSSGSAMAAGAADPLPHISWSFDGVLGKYDRAELQRGLQVYKEVCAACHSLRYVAYRNLVDLQYNEDEIKALASEAIVIDGPDDEGEMFEREGLPSDYFPSPFDNDKAAAASNGGAVPPDLSLMAKARLGGPTYIYALMTGYTDPPADFELMSGLNYNKYFPGHQLAMAAPLFDDGVEYADGTPATVDQQARDITVFLMWAAEPKLEERKQTGLKVIGFLIIMTALLYVVKRKIWADLH